MIYGQSFHNVAALRMKEGKYARRRRSTYVDFLFGLSFGARVNCSRAATAAICLLNSSLSVFLSIGLLLCSVYWRSVALRPYDVAIVLQALRAQPRRQGINSIRSWLKPRLS